MDVDADGNLDMIEAYLFSEWMINDYMDLDSKHYLD